MMPIFNNTQAPHSLEQLKPIVQRLTPEIGELGGRFFKDPQSNKSYSLNTIIKLFESTVKESPFQKATAQDILSKIHELDKEGNALLNDYYQSLENETDFPYSLVVIVATAVRRIFNVFFDRTAKLQELEQEIQRSGIANDRTQPAATPSKSVAPAAVDKPPTPQPEVKMPQPEAKPAPAPTPSKNVAPAAVDKPAQPEIKIIQPEAKPAPAPTPSKNVAPAAVDKPATPQPETKIIQPEAKPAPAPTPSSNVAPAAVDKPATQPEIKKIERKYPDSGMTNKMDMRMAGGKYLDIPLFKDEEILHIFKPLREREAADEYFSVDVKTLENGKHVMQQQSKKSCSAAVAAMMLADHRRKFDVRQIYHRLAADEEVIKADLNMEGLETIENEIDNSKLEDEDNVFQANLEQLKKLIHQNGSAIVSIGGDIGNHFIIVDAINDKDVVLRDPYHGWGISITLDAFQRVYEGGKILQLRSISAPPLKDLSDSVSG